MGVTKPITITLGDGEEYSLFLSLAGGERASERLGGNMGQNIFKLAAAVIFEAIMDKKDMTFEAFKERMPCDTPLLTSITTKLLHLPEPKPGENPLIPTLTV